MTLEVPNLFIILAFAFFFGPMFFLALYGCLASFWRVKRKKKERQGETFYTQEYHNEPKTNDELIQELSDVLGDTKLFLVVDEEGINCDNCVSAEKYHLCEHFTEDNECTKEEDEQE